MIRTAPRASERPPARRRARRVAHARFGASECDEDGFHSLASRARLLSRAPLSYHALHHSQKVTVSLGFASSYCIGRRLFPCAAHSSMHASV